MKCFGMQKCVSVKLLLLLKLCAGLISEGLLLLPIDLLLAAVGKKILIKFSVKVKTLILSYTNPAHYEIELALFEKKCFFDKAEQYLQVLNISNQETINCFFKDVL